MSCTVTQLNGDTSFLLVFSPEAHPTLADRRSANGAFSVLIDPWLVGSSVTTASWFAKTDRVEPSAIQHLSQLADVPDVVICSQNKQDHTNKETLLQLDPAAKTIVVAEPGAAKEIRSWKHFRPGQVYSMAKYDPKAHLGNSFSLPIAPLTPQGLSGELNLTFIPARRDMTGLHNAWGIIYQPPTRTNTLESAGQTGTDRPSQFRYFLSPPSSATSATFSFRTDSSTNASGNNTPTLPEFDFESKAADHSLWHSLPTPPESPNLSTLSSWSRSSTSSATPSTASSVQSSPKPTDTPPQRPKAVSILYTPHGVSLTDLRPYAQRHLIRYSGALPLTLLLHSFHQADNPFFLGGNILRGSMGGMDIAKALMARCWIGAHDEDKDDRGVAVKLLKLHKTAAEDIRLALAVDQAGRQRPWVCDVRHMASGETVVLSNLPREVDINHAPRSTRCGPGRGLTGQSQHVIVPD